MIPKELLAENLWSSKERGWSSLQFLPVSFLIHLETFISFSFVYRICWSVARLAASLFVASSVNIQRVLMALMCAVQPLSERASVCEGQSGQQSRLLTGKKKCFTAGGRSGLCANQPFTHSLRQHALCSGWLEATWPLAASTGTEEDTESEG